VKPWVKTSLAPGSMVVTDYLERAGLTEPLEALGYNLVGYGCTTCIGNSGPLPGDLARDRRARPDRCRGAIGQPQLRGADQPRHEDELPRLAAAGRRLRARRHDGHRLLNDPLGEDRRRRARLPARHLAELGGDRRDRRAGDALRHVPPPLCPGVRRRRALALARGADRRSLRLGRRLDLRAPPAVLREISRSSPSHRPTSSARARWQCSVTR
jgi:hypothetical protein